MPAPSSYFDHYTHGAFAPHVMEHQLVCSSGVWMLDVVQPAGAYPDPPLPELVIQQDLGNARAVIDFGRVGFSFGRASNRWPSARL